MSEWRTVPNVSNNPEYRPSDPPQVGSQQVNNNYGSQPQYGSGQGQQYGSGAGQYGSGPGAEQYGSGAGQYSQGQQYGQGGYSQSGHSQGGSYGEGSYSQGGSYGQSGYSQDGYSQFGANGAYGQAAGYNQPDAYSQQGSYGSYSQPGSYGYGQQGSYSQPMTYGAQPMIVRPVPNKMAVWSMWMGIVGLGGGFVCGLLSMVPVIGILFSIVAMFLWIAPLLAVIFGHIGLGQIKRTGEDGRGQGIAGLIMGYVSIALGLLGLIIVIGFFGLGFMAMLGSGY